MILYSLGLFIAIGSLVYAYLTGEDLNIALAVLGVIMMFFGNKVIGMYDD